MVCFNVKALFKNVPLECTVYLELKRIYENHEIARSITRNEIREIILLCTKNVRFTFRNVVYLQTNGVAVGSPLGPVFAGIFLVHLERSLVPLLTSELSFWKQWHDYFYNNWNSTSFLSMWIISILISNSHMRQNIILN